MVSQGSHPPPLALQSLSVDDATLSMLSHAKLAPTKSPSHRFDDPLARRPAEPHGTPLSGGLLSPSTSGKNLKLKASDSLLSGSSPTLSSGLLPSPSFRASAAAVADSPRHSLLPESPPSAAASPSFFARLLLKKGDKAAAGTPTGIKAAGGLDSGSESEDLDLPIRRYHSYTHNARPELGKSLSFRRGSAVAASGLAGCEGGLQSQTREALQQLLKEAGHSNSNAGLNAGAAAEQEAGESPRCSTPLSSRSIRTPSSRLQHANLTLDRGCSDAEGEDQPHILIGHDDDS